MGDHNQDRWDDARRHYQVQSTDANVRAGLRYLRSWKHRFWMSTRGFWPRSVNGLIYLADYHEIEGLDFLDVNDFNEVEKRCNDKIAFMEAFLGLALLEQPDFESYVKTLLKLQSRTSAPRAYGFWFQQSQSFQGSIMSIFCEDAKQVDFDDISSIMPYDEILVRNPRSNWTAKEAQKLIDYIKWDLCWDGTEIKLKFTRRWDLLYIELLSPDYGLKPSDRVPSIIKTPNAPPSKALQSSAARKYMK
jgi:hypothetical protein